MARIDDVSRPRGALRNGLPACDVEQSSADGFRHALRLEQRALVEALSGAADPVAQQLHALVADLYSMLRTTIHPKGGYRAVAEALHASAVRHDNAVHLRGVLASPTAAAELGSILNCAAIFRRHGLVPSVRLFLVRWENLVDQGSDAPMAGSQAFARQARRLAETALRAGFEGAIIPIDLEVDGEAGAILTPADFGAWSNRIADALRYPRGANPSLLRDVAWSEAFYARQASLSRLGAKQARLDLAIRRAIGQWVSDELSARPGECNGLFALITTELHKRLLTCYAASAPILNIDVRASQVMAPSLAVA